MTWLIAAISAYFILAVVFLVDKYLLTKAIPNPKVYAFYVGALGISVLVLAPFVGFYVPEISQLILGVLSGVFFIYGLFWLYKTLKLFEPSRVVPAIGGLTPFFVFGFIYIFTLGQETLSLKELAAFILLVLGSIFITIKKEKLASFRSLKFSALTAFLLALSFVLVKYVYLVQPFWNGFIWRCIGGFLTAACFFVFFPDVRKEIFRARSSKERGEESRVSFYGKENLQTGKSIKTAVIFLSNQAAGAGATILQNWAIALAPLIYIPFVNALQGTQYAFLFVMAIILSLRSPEILKEEISREVVLQKIIAIILIGAGLALLAF